MDYPAKKFDDLIVPPSSHPPTLPPQDVYQLPHIHIDLPNLKKRSNISDSAMRSLVTSRISETFPNHIQVFTDGSVELKKSFATSAVVIPAFGYEIAGRLSFQTSSTAAELLAIRLALENLI